MTKNILVPYDFTTFSDLAFEKAVEIGRKFDSKVTLLTVIGSDVDTSGMSLSRAEEYYDRMEREAEEKTNRIKRSVSGMDVCTKIIHNPSTADGILSYAEGNKTDLVVVGSHGRSGFKKLVLGSVASAIISKAPCPVLTVKPQKIDNSC